MGKQFIVAISREYASGGHEIALELSKRLGVNFYDRNILDEVAKEKGLDVELLNKYDESPRRHLLSRSVRGYSNSPEEAIAEIQFNYLRDKADSGKSFVVVGRCAESILADYPGLVAIFVTADEDAKLERIMGLRGMNEKEAFATIRRHDNHRKHYHNHFCESNWGDSRAYDLCINSTALGISGTIDFLEGFVKERIRLIEEA